jgi:hypothetical protein
LHSLNGLYSNIHNVIYLSCCSYVGYWTFELYWYFTCYTKQTNWLLWQNKNCNLYLLSIGVMNWSMFTILPLLNISMQWEYFSYRCFTFCIVKIICHQIWLYCKFICWWNDILVKPMSIVLNNWTPCIISSLYYHI